MKRLCSLLFALLLLSCQRPANPHGLVTVDLVPSRQRVFAQNDSEPPVTSWLPLGMSYASAKASILYGLLIEDAPALDEAHKPVGRTLRRGMHVMVRDATEWEPAGHGYRRWYEISQQGSARMDWVDSSSVALITAQHGGLGGGFLERKISVAGGESEYNVLVLCDGAAVSLIDTSALVFPSAFHPSGVTSVSFQDMSSDGTLEAVVQAQTIVSLQFLGASPLAWEAWLREKDHSWSVIFRYNSSYGTDQGNSYSATRRAFSSTGAGFLDTVKVTTNLMETAAQGVFSATTETFFTWNGTMYKEDPAWGMPQKATVLPGSAVLKALPQAGASSVTTLKAGDELFISDRGDARESGGGEAGFWLHATTRAGKDGWILSGQVKLAKIDPLRINREIFLGHSGYQPSTMPDQSGSQ
jgi:hypothetical protein